MRYLFLICGSCLLWFIAPAQQTQLEAEVNLLQLANLNPLGPSARSFDNRYEGVRGTPYLFEKPLAVVVSGVRGGKSYDFSAGNIDAFDNYLVVALDNGQQGAIPAVAIHHIKAVRAPRDTLYFITLRQGEVTEKADSTVRFFELLYQSDKHQLLKLVDKYFQKADYKGAYSANVRYDEYRDRNYYYLRHEGAYLPLKLRMREVKAILGEEAAALAEIKQYDVESEAGFTALLRALDGD